MFSVSFTYIMIPFIHWRNIIQSSNNDHIHTLFPREELPWRHNQTREQWEAQRCKCALGSDVHCRNNFHAKLSIPKSPILKISINLMEMWLYGEDSNTPSMWNEPGSTAYGFGSIIYCFKLTHWGRVTHICVSDLTSIGSDNGLSPGRRQAIIRTNAGLLLIEPLGTNFSDISIEILIFSLKKMRLKVSSAKRRPFCLDLNVLTKFVQ